MKVLALGFDGVISDSAPECFWIALRTVMGVRPGTRYAARLADLEGLRAESARRSVVQHPIFQKFVEVMPLGNRAEDFGVSLLAGWGYNGARERDVALGAGIDVASLEGFDATVFG